jgi:hypothetical protein
MEHEAFTWFGALVGAHYANVATSAFVAMLLNTGILSGFLVNHDDPSPHPFCKCCI